MLFLVFIMYKLYNNIKVFSRFHICNFYFFFHCRPVLTHPRILQRCDTRLLLSDILQCICHLPFHSADGQERTATFSLSQRASPNIFCSARCIRWQNGNCCHSRSADVEARCQNFYLLSLWSVKSATQPLPTTVGKRENNNFTFSLRDCCSISFTPWGTQMIIHQWFTCFFRP